MISAALIFSSNTAAYTQPAVASRFAPSRGVDVQMAENAAGWKAAGLAAALALATGVQSASAGPFTRSEVRPGRLPERACAPGDGVAPPRSHERGSCF